MDVLLFFRRNPALPGPLLLELLRLGPEVSFISSSSSSSSRRRFSDSRSGGVCIVSDTGVD